MKNVFVEALQPDSRPRALQTLAGGRFDVFILGGGVNGAGVARDLTLRARHAGRELRVALIDKAHFCSGTSSRNSQLLHGGLRYLKYLEFRLVREALHERTALLRIAPHLAEPLPFFIPMYSLWERFFYGSGILLYDLLSGSRKVGSWRALSRKEVKALEPDFAQDGLAGGAIYYDCRVHSARLVLENIFEAVRLGATAANYVEALSYERRGDGWWDLRLRDVLSGEEFRAAARKIVDAKGPWGDGGRLRLVRGSHIVIPRVNASDNAIAYFDENGRIVFLIPWGSGRRYTLVGTTDVDHKGSPDDVRISADEVAYLKRIVRRLYPRLNKVEAITAYSSLRPLLQDDRGSPTATSREHKIWNSERGVLHISGGKYTTYRSMSEEATDKICRELAPELAGLHLTAETPLEGNAAGEVRQLEQVAPAIAAAHGLPPEETRELARDYGTHFATVLSLAPPAALEGLSRLRAAGIAFAARHEMAQRLSDVLFVSSYWGYDQRFSRATLYPYAAELARHLGWSPTRIDEEIDAVLRQQEFPDVD